MLTLERRGLGLGAVPAAGYRVPVGSGAELLAAVISGILRRARAVRARSAAAVSSDDVASTTRSRTTSPAPSNRSTAERSISTSRAKRSAAVSEASGWTASTCREGVSDEAHGVAPAVYECPNDAASAHARRP